MGHRLILMLRCRLTIVEQPQSDILETLRVVLAKCGIRQRHQLFFLLILNNF